MQKFLPLSLVVTFFCASLNVHARQPAASRLIGDTVFMSGGKMLYDPGTNTLFFLQFYAQNHTGFICAYDLTKRVTQQLYPADVYALQFLQFAHGRLSYHIDGEEDSVLVLDVAARKIAERTAVTQWPAVVQEARQARYFPIGNNYAALVEGASQYDLYRNLADNQQPVKLAAMPGVLKGLHHSPVINTTALLSYAPANGDVYFRQSLVGDRDHTPVRKVYTVAEKNAVDNGGLVRRSNGKYLIWVDNNVDGESLLLQYDPASGAIARCSFPGIIADVVETKAGKLAVSLIYPSLRATEIVTKVTEETEPNNFVTTATTSTTHIWSDLFLVDADVFDKRNGHIYHIDGVEAEITGTAVNLKAGGMVKDAISGKGYYVEGINRWDNSVAGKRITVTGELLVQPVDPPKKGAPVRQQLTGPMYTIKAPRWELVK